MYIILEQLFASMESILVKQFFRKLLFFRMHLTIGVENYGPI